ncbi:hypothetical protein L873DRAFT_1815704 [Choiromyces venosus 120613-1]|uniref:Uncharacterized protein n=1 Tax=Choiromyces venosus 120613-1 TaxID=1336337 RepID=A0A3N4J5S8_9PEZI|nr:hypothetical protein L873DRAFT_1815704 [Choiromyces venosus 120613-1]
MPWRADGNRVKGARASFSDNVLCRPVRQTSNHGSFYHVDETSIGPPTGREKSDRRLDHLGFDPVPWGFKKLLWFLWEGCLCY